ncbi:MAG: UDP-galactopyranose mutase [Clostridiaceae bacterium]|nr:UDP-galactopyranose mutase [Clostridiaceae bacterium]
MWQALHSHYDYLIVGSGLYGSVFAREAVNHGKRCLVIDRRAQLGGNVYCTEQEGITVHQYGAHIFHTNRKDVWDYVNRYARMMPYIHRVTARSGGKEYTLPFNMHTFQQLWDVADSEAARKKLEEQREHTAEPSNLEEQALALVGYDIYKTLIQGYTEKQWGRACKALPASIIKRLPLRFDKDDRYFTDEYQGIPEGGYNVLIERLLEDVVTITNMSYQVLREAFPEIADKIVYTGPIDQFFDYSLGRLEYRSLRFVTEILEQPDYQGRAVVNACDAEVPFTRVIEHKHFTGQTGKKTVITKEYPEEWTPDREPYYPIEDTRNLALYQQYKALASECPNVIFGGRLGEYRYYNMDQVIAGALERARQEFK